MLYHWMTEASADKLIANKPRERYTTDLIDLIYKEVSYLIFYKTWPAKGHVRQYLDEDIRHE